jgi:outer membrane lipoprotein-sorting protein
MTRNGIIKVLIALLCVMGACRAQSDSNNVPVCRAKDADANSIDAILQQLREKTSRLQSYQCSINYLFSQPLLESQTLKKGILYYVKSGDQSKLRINFETLKQDDEPEQKYIEHYIFDGQWLTQIDYQIKQVKRRQLAEPNETIDAFELVKRNFPIIGFSKTDDLKKQFDINLVGPATARRLCSGSDHNSAFAETSEPNDVIHLYLLVKPDSEYKDDYKSVDVWIDAEKSGLPAKVTATSTNGDIFEIWFVEPKVNEKIDKKVFDFTIPDGFPKPEVIPMRKETN